MMKLRIHEQVRQDVETKWVFTLMKHWKTSKIHLFGYGLVSKTFRHGQVCSNSVHLKSRNVWTIWEEEEQRKTNVEATTTERASWKAASQEKRPNIYIFSQEDLANDDIISMVGNNAYLQAHQDGTGEYPFESNYRRKDCIGTGNHNQHRLHDDYFLNITKRTTFKLYNEYGFIWNRLATISKRPWKPKTKSDWRLCAT